jgi:hypothetical protein
MLKVLAQERRFVFGVYRRHTKAVGYLGRIDRLFGMPATTRDWKPSRRSPRCRKTRRRARGKATGVLSEVAQDVR